MYPKVGGTASRLQQRPLSVPRPSTSCEHQFGCSTELLRPSLCCPRAIAAQDEGMRRPEDFDHCCISVKQVPFVRTLHLETEGTPQPDTDETGLRDRVCL